MPHMIALSPCPRGHGKDTSAPRSNRACRPAMALGLSHPRPSMPQKRPCTCGADRDLVPSAQPLPMAERSSSAQVTWLTTARDENGKLFWPTDTPGDAQGVPTDG